MKVPNANFQDRVAQFDVKWDGPITKIALFDDVGYTIPQGARHDLNYKTMSYLQFVDVDNELVRSPP